MIGYRRFSQSSYASGAWWVAHFAELLGGILGFMTGWALWLLIVLFRPGVDLEWLPFLLAAAGGLGLRAIIRRQAAPSARSAGRTPAE